MGKIKSKSVRKAVRKLNSEGVKFDKNFDRNKKILEGLDVGKKTRNQIAGLLTRENRA